MSLITADVNQVTPRPMRPRRPARRARVLFEALEGRTFRSASPYESLDGTGNNLANTYWGAAGSDLIRLTAAAYSDGVSSPNLAGDASARTISNLVNSQTDPNDSSTELNSTDGNNLSDFGYAFGQFIDHDMDLTPDGGESFAIEVAADDPIGPEALAFTRFAL